ncbi:c-type cytochrome [Rhodovulum visakhapatnamense]|uniref:Cytochrome c553 n=1 Tax=Rhodovulum visakhapatnamense TaxID=364297 RepID=A0A4R8FXT8_9RHOB|nr:c-type cytochrome [Rhodovulum visakhapatnamense]TDX31825.1 cytochrome c553 [Rhodovulum visakhapatnamense]
MKGLSALALGGLMLASAAFGDAAPGDLAAGRKVAGLCRVCHGLQGVAQVPIAPHIAGEPVSYITRQLAAFRSGAREHEMMTVVARGLTDTQIANVATWYSAHTARASLPPGADASAAPALCVTCHGETGIAVNPDAPNLAAETNIYLATQLKAFRSGKRRHEIMSGIAADLTDDEIRASADWYAAMRLEVTEPGAPGPCGAAC